MKINLNGLKRDLLIGLSLRGLGAVSSFALVWLIADRFGARTVGLYQIGLLTATLLSTLAVLGQDVTLVRTISPLLRDGRIGETADAFRAARKFVTRFGLLIAILGAALALPIARHVFAQEDAAPYLAILACLVLLMPILKVQGALIRSLGLTKISQSLEGVFFNTFAMLAFVGIIWIGGWSEPLLVPGFVVAGVLLSVTYGGRVIKARLGNAAQASVRPELLAGAWVAAAPFLGALAGWLISLILSTQLGAAEVGIFRVAVQICLFMQLINASFAAMVGPYLSRAAEAGDIAQVRRTTMLAGAIGVLISSPVLLAALLVPEAILGLFGQEFVMGADALRLLAIGQAINVAAGPVGVAMVMQRREKTVLMILAVATALGVTLAGLLVPVLGVTGAAVGAMTINVVSNLSNWAFVRFSSSDSFRPTNRDNS